MSAADRDDSIAEIIRDASQELLPLPTSLQASTDPIEGIRAVVFDVYGTLFISGSGDISLAKADAREEPMREVLTAAGLTVPDKSDLYDPFAETIREHQERRRGEGIAFPEVEIREVWKDFLATLGFQLDPQAIEPIATRFECRVNPVWPMPELQRTLQRLRERGLKLGIVSNAQFFTPALFRAFLGEWPEPLGFEPHRCVWSYAMREGKPSTALYEKLMASLSERDRLRPEEVAFVGNDMRNDVWPAREIGLRGILFAGDQRSLRLREDDPRSQSEPARTVITSLEQLPRLLA